MITTITVNQWRIKSNAENGANEPVVCVNTYAYRKGNRWGPQVTATEHYHDFNVSEQGASNVKVVHDPVNKTPCGASCWMEYEHA